MKDIRLAFRALLLADPTVNSLVGGNRIYPVQPPQTQRAPSLVYLRIIDFSDYHMLGDSGLQRTSMQLDAWADTHDASVRLADAAHDALTGFRGRAAYGANSPQDFVDIGGIFQTIGRDLFDDTVQMFRMSRDYAISYQSAVEIVTDGGGGDGNSPPADSLVDRLATANWQNSGLRSLGGIPTSRNAVFTTLSPSGGDDTSQIQTALNNCPPNQVVKLNAGVFLINTSQAPLLIATGITLRGSGAGSTIIRKNTGAAAVRLGTQVNGTTIFTPAPQPSLDNAPLIVVGPNRFSGVDVGAGGTSNLTSDGIAGASSITVVDGTKFTVGRMVLLDELSMAAYAPTPPGFLNNNTNGTEGTVQVLRGDRVVWNIHNPTQTFQDDPVDAFGWFSRADPLGSTPAAHTDGRVTCEIKEITAISGNTITFSSPLTLTYRASHGAQLTRYSATGSASTANSVHTRLAGVEALTLHRSGGGGIFFTCAAYCWAKNIEIDSCFGLGVGMSDAFRVEIRDSYIHTSAQPTPAADSYAICPANGSSELLIENNIMIDYCKVIAFRACGAGSVVGYNYTDNGWDWYDTGNAVTDGQYAAFVEAGANASHMAGCHHVLFEGNYSFNFDSDYTHGNSIYMTVLRNHLSGQRRNFTDSAHVRAGSGATWSWWLSYIGNILGRSGQMTGWVYTDARMGCDVNGNNCAGFPSSGWNNGTGWSDKAIWKIGFDPERFPQNPDSQTLATLIRDGNYDFLTNSQRWHNTPATFAIPNSYYLSATPAFFGANAWPWINPATGAIAILPAKKRFDDSTPNIVP